MTLALRKAHACLLLLALSPHAVLSAQEWLAEFPSPARVVEAMRGSDDVETAARRYGALRTLRVVLRVRNGMPRTLRVHPPPITAPPAAATLDRAYEAAATRVVKEFRASIDTSCTERPCPAWRFTSLINTSYDPSAFEREVLQTFFSSGWADDYHGSGRAKPVRQNAVMEKLTGRRGADLLYSIALLAGSLFVIVMAFRKAKALDRYEFENRTGGGVVQFPTYEASRAHERAIGFTRFFMNVGIGGLLLGILGVVVTLFTDA